MTIHRLLHYLRSTATRCLHYSHDSPTLLHAFSNADYGGFLDTRRSTTGYCVFLGNSLLSWKSKKHTSVSKSSTGAKYRAMSTTCSEVVWLRRLLADFGIQSSSPTPIYCDNECVVKSAINPVFHKRIKHIEIDCHIVREKFNDDLISLPHVSSRDQLTDFFHQISVIHGCSILAAVGQRMASTSGVSATFFSALAKANINIRAIAQGCSEFNVTVVVKQEECVRALRAVHSRFYLSRTSIAVGIVGPGLIGGTLLEQLKDQSAVLKEKFNIDLRVMGITGKRSMLLSDSGIDLSKWKELLSEKGEMADLNKFVQHVSENYFIPNSVLVDCTADSHIASHYYDWLQRGIHVVTPNKKANSGPLDQYLKLRDLQRQSYTHYFYEATVGAGLPIISTLRGLLETGDKILRIEGIFSGTLSYIFNNFAGTKTFSQVVKEAKEAGYTEPDPRDDLSGTDVARKVIILARESGLDPELSDIPVQSLVPEPLRATASAEDFLLDLPKFDQELSEQRQEAEDEGEVLRYVGVVDIVNGKGAVELRRYNKEHPFAQLSGSDNIIAFTTERYCKQPLIVRGPGAGAEVTAGGVFSDILRLASYLGAPS
ncbi:Bifunctional aspartokinase/homoserine dehydrogenase 1, chloroplastic [Capsicum annuum]|nr:Bifunctional aspartokinase/homoserine dehydrogenase 1, chloroplastic [Capsicum annuum]